MVDGSVGANGGGGATTEVTAFVNQLLAQMQARFNTMSENIVTKIDELGARCVAVEGWEAVHTHERNSFHSRFVKWTVL